MHALEAQRASLLERLDRGPQRIVHRLDDLRPLIDETSARRVLLVLHRTAIDGAGLGDVLARALAGLEVTAFDAFSPNPRAEHGAAAARIAGACGADLVLAIGGGSCIDVGKVAALAARHADKADALSRGEMPGDPDPLPLIAVPTTSGTGSETTHFAAIYVDGRKVSVTHPRLRPHAVVLDARLHVAMPQRLAAVTGLDALGQALESLWAIGSNDESTEHALAALSLIADSIEPSVVAADPAAREAMMFGSHFAGRAINISKTTASHALSYQLTQRFGLAHGHGVALTLGHVGAANALVNDHTCADPRGVKHVRHAVSQGAAMLGCSPQALPGKMQSLLRNLGLQATLAEAGVPKSQLAQLAGAVDSVRLGNNPRRFSPDELEAVLNAAHAGVPANAELTPARSPPHPQAGCCRSTP